MVCSVLSPYIPVSMNTAVQTILRPAKMMFCIVLLASVAYAAAQQGCNYVHDNTSPFYWKHEKDLCTDTMCTKQGLNCVYPAEDIHDAVVAHRLTTGENIMYEIGILERTFNATFPDEAFGSTSAYQCQGICERPVKRLERIFYDYPIKDKFGQPSISRQLCFVVGPQIRYSSCSGKPCAIKGIMAGTEAYNCVPDVTTSLTVWLYCPDIMPQCVKTQLDIPISCSCKRFQCPQKVDPLASTGGKGLDLFGGMDLFSGGLSAPVSGADPLGAPQPVDILPGSNLDFPGGSFQPVDVGAFGQTGFSDQVMGGSHLAGAQSHASAKVDIGAVHSIV